MQPQSTGRSTGSYARSWQRTPSESACQDWPTTLLAEAFNCNIEHYPRIPICNIPNCSTRGPDQGHEANSLIKIGRVGDFRHHGLSMRASRQIPTSSGALANLPTLTTPIFPLRTPQRLRLMRSIGNVLESPKQRIERFMPNAPVSNIGRRPIRSDKLPQNMTVRHSQAKKTDSMAPT